MLRSASCRRSASSRTALAHPRSAHRDGDRRIVTTTTDADRRQSVRRRRPGRLAGHRRHPRPHQRAGPHRVGRLRYRDARGRGRRRDDDRRHAAQQHAGDDDGRRRSRRSGTRRAGSVTSTSASGAASCRATPRELDALVDAGVRGFKCFLVPSGVDEFPAVDEARSAARRCRSSRAAACRCSSTPSHRARSSKPTPTDPRPRRTRRISPRGRPRPKSTRSG